MAEYEKSHEAKLERDWEELEAMYQKDLEDWQRAQLFFQELLEYDLNRWERHEELNRNIWEDVMKGDMNNFERTLPWILY